MSEGSTGQQGSTGEDSETLDTYRAAFAALPGDIPFRLDRKTLVDLVTATRPVEAALADGSVVVEGETGGFTQLIGLLDRFDFWFGIVTP